MTMGGGHTQSLGHSKGSAWQVGRGGGKYMVPTDVRRGW